MDNQPTGETEAIYTRNMVTIATAIIDRINAAGNPQLRGAIFGIARLADANPDHKLCRNVVETKLRAFHVSPDEITRFRDLVETGTMTDLIEYIHPTLEDSKYVYLFHGL